MNVVQTVVEFYPPATLAAEVGPASDSGLATPPPSGDTGVPPITPTATPPAVKRIIKT